jgi:glycosyltransferase involved in cell wall biosynthesis
MNYPVDIIVPVWNRPVESRACLAALADHAPEARLVMVNNGSERETERILDEFAEALDDRAMLIATDRALESVAALNIGLERSSAPVAVLVQEGVAFGPGWLAPLVDVLSLRADAGLVVPNGALSGRGRPGGVRETDHGSFSAMVMRRELFDRIGGFDLELDGGLWALKDYSRRSEQAGFRTMTVPVPDLTVTPPRHLGSSLKRAERDRLGAQRYAERWGASRQFCLLLNGADGEPDVHDLATTVLAAARLGHRVRILPSRARYRELVAAGLHQLHDSIELEPAPLLMPRRALARRLAALAAEEPATVLVQAPAGQAPAGESFGFDQLQSCLRADRVAFYGSEECGS